MGAYTYESFINELLAVVVLYKKKPSQSISLECIEKQKHANEIQTLLVDNSPEALQEETLKTHYEYIHQPENPGVSRSYNMAAEKAKSMGRKWLLLLDDDSSLPSDYLEQIHETVSQFPCYLVFAPIVSTERGVISPCRYHFHRGSELGKIETGPQTFKGKSLVNSGLVLDVCVFEKTGGYNERIPLDYSDHYFVRQLNKHQIKVVVCKVGFAHQLSAQEQKKNEIEIWRFRFFCRGAIEMIGSARDLLILIPYILAKAIKKTIHHSSLSFLLVALKSMFNKVAR
jgi:rhamnosyltransferase